MGRTASRHPTARELEILKVVWDRGRATVREVLEALSQSGRHESAYTSLMTVMSTMVDKGYLRRKKVGIGYVYEARIARQTTTRRMLQDLIHSAFDGSAANVALGLLQETDLDASQLQQLKQLIRQQSERR